MATIQNVRLQIVENEGAAGALVTFRLIGSAEDLLQDRAYAEIVELIGVDNIPNDDGTDEPIPFGRSEGAVIFSGPSPSLNRTRLLALPAAGLNEDSNAPGPHTGHVDMDPDEIRARVTLTRSVSAESEIVVLHQSLIFDPVQV